MSSLTRRLQLLSPSECYECADRAHTAQVCLFSYGQTGAGKTHTMQGGSGTQQGIIPRSVHKVRSNSLAEDMLQCNLV